CATPAYYGLDYW
nr:immunoglobulin heavy chain junction region [Mus musculus]